MSFQAIVPSSGLVGWSFLQRTYDSQLDTFSQDVIRKRDTTYFTDKIGNISTAEDLVSDRRLLSVALRAFGLEDDLNNTYFVRKILEDGTSASDALANRMADNRYRAFSETFGFGPGEVRTTADRAAMAEVVDSYVKHSFEVSVGQVSDSLRVALYAQRELAELAEKDSSETTKWYSVMGQPALRRTFETALGLPSSFSQLDIDKQLEVFQEKTARALGADSISQFAAPAAMERLTELYLARSQINEMSAAYSSTATALTLLRGF